MRNRLFLFLLIVFWRWRVIVSAAWARRALLARRRGCRCERSRFLVTRFVRGPFLNSAWRWEPFDVIEAPDRMQALSAALRRHPGEMLDCPPRPPVGFTILK